MSGLLSTQMYSAFKSAAVDERRYLRYNQSIEGIFSVLSVFTLEDRETELCASITSSQLGTQKQCPYLRFTFPEDRIKPVEEIAILLLKMLLFMEGAK